MHLLNESDLRNWMQRTLCLCTSRSLWLTHSDRRLGLELVDAIGRQLGLLALRSRGWPTPAPLPAELESALDAGQGRIRSLLARLNPDDVDG